MKKLTSTPQRSAHLFRRLIHLSNIFWPWLYYAYGNLLADILHSTARDLLWWIIVVLLAAEVLRLIGGWRVFGQRMYEKTSISAFTWGGISTALVLLYAPSKGYALAIITSYALVDPLLGELRAKKLPIYWIIFAGMTTVTLVWLFSSLFFNLAWWLAPIMGIITVAAEWPSLRWIDDNAMLQLIPLLVIKFLS